METETQQPKPIKKRTRRDYFERGVVAAFVIGLVVTGGWALNYFAGTKTYTSTHEGVKFSYPNRWRSIPPKEKSAGDRFSIQSPSGKVQVEWLSSVTITGGCSLYAPKKDIPQCVQVNILSKQDLPHIKGLSVFSGTVTVDYKNYRPFLAVQETKSPMLKEGLGLSFDAFHLVGQKPPRGSLAVLSTSGSQAGSEKMSKDEAEKWFKTSEAKQAKGILLSLKYIPAKNIPNKSTTPSKTPTPASPNSGAASQKK